MTAGQKPTRKPEVFDGQTKSSVVCGYSTSARWPGFLQKKLDRLEVPTWSRDELKTALGEPLWARVAPAR